MKIIPAVIVSGVASPAEPFPDDATAIVCDGVQYVVHQVGDVVAVDEVPADADAGPV